MFESSSGVLSHATLRSQERGFLSPSALCDREKDRAKLVVSFMSMMLTKTDPHLFSFEKQDALTDLTGQQEELNIEGVETCHAHKVHAHQVFLLVVTKLKEACHGLRMLKRSI